MILVALFSAFTLLPTSPKIAEAIRLFLKDLCCGSHPLSPQGSFATDFPLHLLYFLGLSLTSCHQHLNLLRSLVFKKISPVSPIAPAFSLSPPLLTNSFQLPTLLSWLSHTPLSLHPTDKLHWTFGSCHSYRFCPHHFTKAAQVPSDLYIYLSKGHFNLLNWKSPQSWKWKFGFHCYTILGFLLLIWPFLLGVV